MRTITCVAFVLSVLAGCASDKEPELVAGFSPPPPGPGEVQYLSPIVHDIKPGEDRIVCSYLDAYIDEDMDVASIAGYNTTGSHHIILYSSSLAQAPNTHECKDEEMVFLSLVGGAGGDGAASPQIKMPDGLVRRVKGGNQLVIQTHWLNSGDETIDGQAAFNVKYEATSPGKTPTDFLVVMNTVFDATPGTSSASVDCALEQPVSVWWLAGHQHSLGKHIRLAYTPMGGSEQVLFDEDFSKEWTFNPRMIDYSATPMVLQPGDRLHVDCQWQNPGDTTVKFPDEMCGLIGGFYPSTSQLTCLNGGWLGG